MSQPSATDKEEAMQQIAFLQKNGQQLNAWFVNWLRPLLEQLGDGAYQIGPPYAYINRQGKFCPSRLLCITKVNKTTPVTAAGTITANGQIDQALQQAIDARVAELAASCPMHDVRYVNGKAEPYEVRGLYVNIFHHQVQQASAN